VDLLKTGLELAPFELRAMTMIARAGTNGLAQPQRAMLDAMQRLVLETDLELYDLPPISGEELAGHCEDSAQARQLIRLMVVLSLADGPPSQEQMDLLRVFAAALKVDEPAVKVIGHLADHNLLRFRLAFARRSHVRTYFRNSKQILGGVLPVVKAILRFRGVVREDHDLAARFRALGDLPEGTLGHAFFDHCRSERIPFAGEKGGFPIGAVYHDFAHVLGGYDTTPEGEIKNAAFQAGFCKGDEDFFTTLFANIIHTSGINLAPFPMPVLRGRIGQGSLAMDWLRGLQRGAAMNVDLGDNWDLWDYVELSVDEVREKFGIQPLTSEAA